jgi:predicted phosphodiesterase
VIYKRAALWLVLVLAFTGRTVEGQALSFGVIGDSGSGDIRQQEVARAMVQWSAAHPWQFIMMLGDNIYEDGNPAYFSSNFLIPYRELIHRGIPFHSVLGNHDRRHPAARLGCAQVEEKAFGYVGGTDEYPFEVDIPDSPGLKARFLVINSSAWEEILESGREDTLPCKDQSMSRLDRFKKWMDSSKHYRWNLLFMHHPLYSFLKPWYIPPFYHGHGGSPRLRAKLEPLMEGKKVDVVFAGHDHLYQKIRPQQGIHYFVSGGGSRLRSGGNFNHPQVEFGAQQLHFIDVKLTQNEMKFQVIDSQGKVFHSGTISK